MTLQVGDLVMLIRVGRPDMSKYIGHCFTVASPLMPDPLLEHVLAHRLEPAPPPYHAAWCTPAFLLKITPPPDFVDEDERDELTV